MPTDRVLDIILLLKNYSAKSWRRVSKKQGGQLEIYELNYPCTHLSIAVAQYKGHTLTIPLKDLVYIIKKALQ